MRLFRRPPRRRIASDGSTGYRCSGPRPNARSGRSRLSSELYGLSGPLRPPKGRKAGNDPYVGTADPRNPLLSPIFADLHGLPPTLFMSSTRDMLLSGTTLLHRAFLRDGVDARLVVFEALPHAFWNEWYLPESIEAHRLMAHFFEKQFGK
ncbi:MAG: alpha/beta hydrolase [Opitutaceae bacterium]